MKASASAWAQAGETEGGGAEAGELARLGSLDGQRGGLGRARGSGNASKVSGQKVKSLSSPASRVSGQSFCVVQRPGQCWQDIKVSRPATGHCLSPSGGPSIPPPALLPRRGLWMVLLQGRRGL